MTDPHQPPYPGVFFEDGALAEKSPLPGIAMELGWGEKLMLSRVTIEPGAEIPEHSHPHEQAGICLEGAFDLTVEGETRTVRPGEIYLIPGGVSHSVRGLDQPSKTLDVFAPVREEYLPER